MKLPGASRMADRILANLRAYAANPVRTDFESCWRCSPLPSHILAAPCALCREDVAAEEKRLAALPPVEEPDPERSWLEQLDDAVRP